METSEKISKPKRRRPVEHRVRIQEKSPLAKFLVRKYIDYIWSVYNDTPIVDGKVKLPELKDFAQSCGTNRPTMSRWMRGETKPRYSNWQKLEKIFREDPEFLSVAPPPEELDELIAEAVDSLDANTKMSIYEIIQKHQSELDPLKAGKLKNKSI